MRHASDGLRGPILAWPGWRHLGRFLLLATVVGVWWMAVYIGCDAITARHGRRVRLHLDVELSMPFVPALIVVYQSLPIAFCLAPFILRSRGELAALAAGLAVETGIAGVGFLALPGDLAYPPADAGIWTPLYTLNHRVVLIYNLLPSLHVAMGALTLMACATRAGRPGKWVLLGWAAAIAVSTLLTHQHHVADVVAGLALGWVAFRWIYLPSSPAPCIGANASL